MKKRFTEEQIIGFLNEAEAGVLVKDLCRKHGFSDAAFYGWRTKFRRMKVEEAKRLRPLRKMYGPPRICKALWSVDENSLRKCIRPLASGLRLQPGHDEMRAVGSYQAWCELESSLSVPRLTERRSTVSSSSL